IRVEVVAGLFAVFIQGKMLHAKYLIYHQAAVERFGLEHEDPALLASANEALTKKGGEIEKWQQAAAHVGYASHPRLNAGQVGIAGHLEHFRDFTHGGHKITPHERKADTAPVRANIGLCG